MKILIVRLFPYEININSYNVQEIGLAKALIKNGHHCDIVFYTKGKERQEKIKVDNEKEITIFWVKGINFFKNGLYGNKIIKLAQNYDIVQSSEYDQIYNLKLNKKIKDKLIIYHGPYFEHFNKGYNFKCKVFDTFFLNKSYRSVKFITKSRLATEFLTNKGLANVTTIGVGLNDEKFVEQMNNQKQLIEFDKDYKYILYVGKLEERRNIKFIFNVLKKVKDKYNNTKLLLIGNGEKEYKEEIFEYAKEIGVFDSIIYKEKIQQDEVKYIYEQSNVFILPTKYEIFGMVLLEAMYFGLPVVTTLNGGSSTIIENNVNGFVCEENEEKYANIIVGLFSDKNKSDTISIEAKKTIKEKFLWNKLVDRFIEEYHKIS